MLRMNRRPLIWFVISWVCGSAAAAGLSSRGAVLMTGTLAMLALAAALCRQASWPLAAACMVAAGLAAGERMWADARNVTALPALLAAAEADGPQASYAAEAVGTIVSAVEVDGDRVIFRVAANSVRVKGEAAPRELRERLIVHVRLAEQPEQAVAAKWQRGDLVRIAGELTRPAGASNSGGFDYRRYLSSQRIHWLLKAKGTAAVKSAPGPKLTAAALLGRVDEARAALGARFDRLYPSDQSGYMKGLVLGIREDLDPEQFQQFSRLGLTHILAISGLHVAVFIYVFSGFLRMLRMTRERILLLLIFAVPLYVLLSGGSPSVVRAGVMAVLGLLAARYGKLKDGLHLLAAAALLMLVVDPFFIENVSFQLSFIVTIGLIIGVPPVRKMMPQSKRGKAWFDLAAVTIVAQLVSFPVSIYYFNQFHALSLLANFVLVPFISFVVMPLGSIALIIAIPWESGGKLLAYVSHYANNWTFILVDKLSQVDSLRSIWASPPLWWVALWFVLLGAAFYTLKIRSEQSNASYSDQSLIMDETVPIDQSTTIEAALKTSSGHADSDPEVIQSKKRFQIGFLMLAISAFGLLFYAYQPQLWSRAATVSILDVGQGDAIHIRTPRGKHILIDGGGAVTFRKPGEEWKERSDPFEVGRKVIVPLLMKRGVQQIDLLVISHLDSDHIKGLKAVLDTIPVRRIWWNGTVKDAGDAKELLQQVIDLGIPLYAAYEGLNYQLEADLKLRVLWPEAPRNADIVLTEDQNESSVVLYVDIYSKSFLFSGDIGNESERAIVRKLQDKEQNQINPTVSTMKVAHHGSRFSTSREWLEYWKPFGAVTSVSATNSYGHPHPDVLTRIKEAGAQNWRTDKDGEIRFAVTNRGLYFSD